MIKQFTHDFIAENGVRSRCNVRIFSDDGEHFILFENLGIGQSVTNASELLATQIVAKMKYLPMDCKFFETYREYDYESIDEVEYSWRYEPKTDSWIARNARWKPTDDSYRDMFLS